MLQYEVYPIRKICQFIPHPPYPSIFFSSARTLQVRLKFGNLVKKKRKKYDIPFPPQYETSYNQTENSKPQFCYPEARHSHSSRHQSHIEEETAQLCPLNPACITTITTIGLSTFCVVVQSTESNYNSDFCHVNLEQIPPYPSNFNLDIHMCMISVFIWT